MVMGWGVIVFGMIEDGYYYIEILYLRLFLCMDLIVGILFLF